MWDEANSKVSYDKEKTELGICPPVLKSLNEAEYLNGYSNTFIHFLILRPWVQQEIEPDGWAYLLNHADPNRNFDGEIMAFGAMSGGDIDTIIDNLFAYGFNYNKGFTFLVSNKMVKISIYYENMIALIY